MDLTKMGGSSMAGQSALPDAWAERLFQRMEDRYGSIWSDRYGAFPRERVKRSWAEDLGDLTREELVRGVEACRDQKFPPTLPEFHALCRPAMDAEVMFHHAVEQMRLREEGCDKWSSAAVYWAAVSLGVDLKNNPYHAIKARWNAALIDAKTGIASGELANVVPIKAPALSQPGSTTNPEVAKASIDVMRTMIDSKKDPLAWARKILARRDAGEAMPWISIEFATKALAQEGPRV